MLLIDALRTSFEISQSIGSFAVVVYPLDEDGESFYRKYGFILLRDSGELFLLMNSIGRLSEEKETT